MYNNKENKEHKPTKQNQLSISSKKKKQDQILLVNNNGEKKKQDQILLDSGEKVKQDQILLVNNNVTKIIENLRAKNLKEIKSILLNDENKPVVGSVEDALKFKMEFYNHLNSFELETLDRLLRNHLVETLEPDGQLKNVLSIIETYDIESQKSQKEFEKLKYFELLNSKNYDEAYNYLYEKISDVDSSGIEYLLDINNYIKNTNNYNLINKMNELIISKDIAINEEIIRYILMGYFESHKFDEPLNLWNKLREMKVIKLNSLLYSEMIRGFSMKNHLQPVEKLWKEMKSDKVEPNLQIYSSLMEINFKLGKVDKAIEIFKESNNLINSGGVSGAGADGKDTANSSTTSSGNHRIISDSYLINQKLIKGLLMNRKQEEALRVYNYLKDNHFDNSNRSGGRSNYNNLRNKNRNIINYSLMIKRDIKNNDLEKLNLTLSEMKSENISLTL
nr:5923_t:CDS:2 [Entrophospora candida]